MHDALHVVIHGLNEARAALRIFVLSAGAFGFAGLAIVKPIAPSGLLADTVLGVEADVEPDRRIKRAILIHAQPNQLLVKDFTFRLVEIAVTHTPISNRAADALNQLADGSLTLAGVLFAVEIFGHNDFRGEQGPGLGHFDVFLFENDLAGIISDFGGAHFPFDLVKWFDRWAAKNSIHGERFLGAGLRKTTSGWLGTLPMGGLDGRVDFIACINHGNPFLSLCSDFSLNCF
jgi:hypothetical protein